MSDHLHEDVRSPSIPFTPIPRDAAQLRSNYEGDFDYVVVGSGAGGAVIAKELAESGARVCIVEEGGYHREHRDPAFGAIRRLYRDDGLTSTLGRPIIPVPMGKAFGGTTVINSGTCFRVPEPVLQNWRDKHGLTDLTLEELSSCYERVEKIINVQEASFDVMSRSNSLIHEIFAKAGYQGRPLRRNIINCEGCGMCCYGCSSKAKQSMDVSYLPRAMAAGAVAFTHARVVQIVRDGTSVGSPARGVVADAIERSGRRTGFQLKIRARKTIIAGGTFLTPKLLKTNGIAKRNKHLGRHLSLHPATKIYAEFDEKINGWDGTPQAYYLDVFKNEGIMFEGIFTPPDLAGLTTPFVGKKLIEFMKRYAHMTSFGMMIHDESEGRMVWLPLMGWSFYYELTPGDIRRIKKGISFLARMFFQGGAKRVYPLVRNRTFNTIADVDKFDASPLRASDIDMMAFHPLGSCRMGTDASQGVVNQNHEVFGTPNLLICDGSVIPTSLGVNPQLTIMAFATRLARKLIASQSAR